MPDLRDGESVEMQGSSTVRFGRIGTDGQTDVKTFPDATAAAKQAEKKIKVKTGKGYVEVS